MPSKNEKIVSLTRKDFVVQTFRAGGKGGQKQNKTSSGVRIIHPASGARCEARDERSQHQNRKLAFERLTRSPRFRAWLAKEHQAALGRKTPEERAQEMMRPENLRIETKDASGRWRVIDDNEVIS